jgi:hypothetical protein
VAAVLDEHDDDEPRVFDRREPREPRVVLELPAVGARPDHRLAPDDLSGPRLAADIQARDPRGERGPPRLVDDGPHAVQDDRRPGGIERHPFARLHAVAQRRAGARVLGGEEEMWGRQAAPVDERRQPTRHLERGDEDRPLADRDRDRLARVPARVPLLERPLFGRNEPGLLERKIHAGRGAEPERARDLGDVFDPEATPQVVEVDIARHLDRVAQVDPAVSVLLVTMKSPPVEGRLARAEHPLLRVHQAQRERPVSHVDLEDRAGGERVLNGAVLERRVGIADQTRPLARAHAAGEPVRIVRRGGDENQDLARLRIHRHCRADLVLEEVLRDPLEAEVERQENVLSRLSLDTLLLRDLPAVGIHDDPPLPVDTCQQLLVGALDPLLAHPVPEPVFLLDAFDLFRARLREVAQGVGSGRAERVETPLCDGNDEFGVLRHARLDRRDVFDPEVLGDRDRQELRVVQPALDPRAQLVARHLQHTRGEVDRGLEVPGLPAVEVERVTRLVVHQDRASRGFDPPNEGAPILANLQHRGLRPP